ncbi:DNA polymerase-3 subunit gamma/tau [Nocardia sp. GAS34]|uniref:DNA polymerase III subunit gamma and tau n=1 Tax=unclassified Nocardia TaxID=2637762 RepID=UPI003D1FFDEA
MALYRKYRPATFAEVIGQEHVTEPLSTALDTGRISHAYLFSGPRGCGKTSSARILARSLNCEQGPTSRPCGVCASCVALAPGGPGNLDVIELDAASHGGVDDTRELRDRAFYTPAESRYRVFIVDEAHMVTTAGFNALLKIVEEPPAHLIFIFATTEPDKVLPTIRSRTHHYPFRLLPPATMRGLLGTICEQEGVPVEEAVYPLVIRAGGGSPRDSLSVLDQLLAGAGPEGVTYPRALALLGVTDIALIDEAVEALAASDGAALFGAVDRVVEGGHDPRRFAGDLLERVRDLILLRAVPDAAERNLVTGPGDVLERMRDQAQRLGPAALARYAELLHAGLGEMRGATAPRLLLEVVCARMLLPVASDDESATLQRLERLERQLAGGSVPAPAPGAAASARPPAPGDGAPEQPRPPAGGQQAGPPRRRGAEMLAAMREERTADGGGAVGSAAQTATAPADSSRSVSSPSDSPANPARPAVGGVSEQRPHPAQRAQAPDGPESSRPQQDSARAAAGPESSGPQSVPDERAVSVETGQEQDRSAQPHSGTPAGVVSPPPASAPVADPETIRPTSAAAAAHAATPPASALPVDLESTRPSAPAAGSGVPQQDSTAPVGPDPAEFAFSPGAPADGVPKALTDVASPRDSRATGGDVDAHTESVERGTAGDVDVASTTRPQPVAQSEPATQPRPVAQSEPAARPQPVGEAEPAAQLQPVARFEPATHPEPAAQSEPAQQPHPESTSSVRGELGEIETAWGDIRAKVREFSVAVSALLSGATVARLEGDTVVCAHPHQPLAQRLSQPSNVQAVQSAIQAVLGRTYEVRWEVGSGAPAANPGAAAKPQGTPKREAPARQSEPPRFTRPSQARGGGSDSGAASGRPAAGGDSGRSPGREPVTRATPPDDDIPLPDGPDLPDDPGPADYSPVGYDGVPPASTPEEEQEMLAESATPVPQEQRRDPDEVALELLSSQLGATRLEA